MNNTKEAELLRTRIEGLLEKKRDYRREIKDLAGSRRYVAFYCCGAILNTIVETWNSQVGSNIDFCCDSDSGKWGQYFSGIRCVSPDELAALKENCTVFVTVGEFRPV